MPSGASFPKGVTTNRFRVTDASGNTVECNFTAIVVDQESPVMSCPSNIIVPCSINLLVPVVMPVTTAANCDSNPTLSFSNAPSGGFPVGTTIVICTATDSAGNHSSCNSVVLTFRLS